MCGAPGVPVQELYMAQDASPPEDLFGVLMARIHLGGGGDRGNVLDPASGLHR